MVSSNGQRNSIWVSDFETTTLAEDCRVWAWAICNVEDTRIVEIGKDLDSYMTRICQTSSTHYFHNLAFDGSFIIDWLFRQGFKHSTARGPKKREFTTLISNTAKFYSITVTWRNGHTTEFRDSLKKLPMSVSNIARAFKLEDTKGELDYRLERPVGWEPTAEEREYIRKDAVIVAQALKIELDAGMTKLTVGADSLAEYKRISGTTWFNRMFPVLPDSMDAEIRKAYRGGFTYADDRFKQRLLGKGKTYDVNSLYPSVMYDRVLPFGEPVFFEGFPEPTELHPLFLVSITFTATLKKDHIPCIQIKGNSQFVATDYLEVIDEPTTLMVTSVDLALWEDHYDLEIHAYNGGWLFKGIRGVFDKFIDKWMGVKTTSEGGMREIAKLHLNSLYGKFATNPNVTGKVPVFEDDVVKLRTGEEETRPPVYTAMGVFITAYARDVTIRAAQANYDVFAYADTDSLHLMTWEEPVGIDVDPLKLGAWKLEYAFDAALFWRAKTYTEHVPKKGYVTHIAGMPGMIAKQVTFEDYVDGKKFPGKLLPKRVPGGIVLEDVTFTLKT